MLQQVSTNGGSIPHATTAGDFQIKPTDKSTIHLKIISGLSGSGKSIALSALEDIGFYCVDNLPVTLLEEFTQKVLVSDQNMIRYAAVGIDSRNQSFLEYLKESLEKISDIGVSIDFMFLEAEEAILVKRYSETRRVHPLMSDSVSLVDSIKLERQLLAPLAERATKHLDTTNLTPHDLRFLIQEDTADFHIGSEILLFKSFAYKYGAPLDADYVFDVRCLPNPYWVEGLKQYNGLEEPIQKYFATKPEVDQMIEQIDEFISGWLSEFRSRGRPYLIVAVGCTGGRHRSVYVVERLEERFAARGVVVQKRHSEIS